MEIDPSEPDSTLLTKHKSDALQQSLATSSLSNSISKLSGSSRGIPSDKDFHFYYLFDEFRAPIDAIAAASQSMLEKIGDASDQFPFPREEIDDDAAYDWLVSVNDEVLERVDSSVEEFLRMRREKEGKAAAVVGVDEDGFQLVSGKKKRIGRGESGGGVGVSEAAVRVVEKEKKAMGTGKAKVPFHISTIRRPQDEFNILVNNANQGFEHVWLQKSEDGSRFIHPLEALSVNDFVDRKTGEPLKPAPLADTPFKMVETVKDLKEMAAKLRNADEIAVDLEHNQYRSFQGLTCLMQISTRTEDFVVDTLKLRVHIGPYLREIFKDPSKKKVMHGADRDVVWLQRDFGIYICNLFDTGQASRVLKLERNSLEYLLHHFCDVTANKEYQNAEWRLRPLPREMIRYAREDTHYLLYIYDVMRARLLSESTVDENSNDLLLEVYQRSYDVCMQLYEKELLTETSYLHVYGLQTANFNAQQLAVASGLYEWRDVVARAEDESTGYILPNKTLMEIAKQMPVTTGKLKHLVRYKHPYIERNLSSVVNIIRHSIQHSAAFEAVVKQLAEARPVVAPEPVPSVGEEPVSVPDSSMADKVSDNSDPGVEIGKAGAVDSSLNVTPKVSHNNNEPNGGVDTQSARQSLAADSNSCEKNTSRLEPAKATGATVQILKRPSRAFGALLGSSSSKKKVDPSKKEKELTKLEQIKSSVNLPFHSFVGDDQTSKNAAKPPSERDDQTALNAANGPSDTMDACSSEENHDMHTESKTEDVILLEGNSDDDETPINSEAAASEHAETKEDSLRKPESGPDDDDEDVDEDEDELMSLSDLSSTFNKCLQSSNENQQNRSVGTSKQQPFKPFDYEEARKTIKFGEPVKRSKAGANGDGSSSSKSGSKSKKGGEGKQHGDQAGLLPQGRRRQAFPASGNRSATFL